MKISTIKNTTIETTVNIVILIFLVFTFIAGLFVPITSDAGKYAAISRNIYENGDWINLRIHFEPYLQKPPLLFWITTPFYFIFGVNEFAFKFPVLLYSILAAYSTYKLTNLFYGKKLAGIATLMLITSEFYFLFHADIHTDSLLAANVIFASWQLVAYFKTRKTINMLLSGFGIGLALISKGPIGVFVPVTGALCHLIYTKRIKLLFSYKIILGAIVTVVVLAIGLTGIYNQFSFDGLKFFFWDNNAGRISGAIKGRGIDPLFYFHNTLSIFLPWGILFFIACFYEVKELISGKSKEMFCFGAIFFYWVIISFAQARSPHYLMVLAPFMAILTAKWTLRLYAAGNSTKIKTVIKYSQYTTMAIIWGLFILICVLFFPLKKFFIWCAVVLLFSLIFVKSNDKLKLLLRRTIISIVMINFVLNTHLFSELFKYQSVIPACRFFNEQAGDEALLSSYLSEHRELFFYAKKPGYFLYNSDDLNNYLSTSGNWVYTNDKGLAEIQGSGAGIELVKSFKHSKVYGFGLGFLNPATRDKHLNPMYLVKITEPVK